MERRALALMDCRATATGLTDQHGQGLVVVVGALEVPCCGDCSPGNPLPVTRVTRSLNSCWD
jgi:hypothetical protein